MIRKKWLLWAGMAGTPPLLALTVVLLVNSVVHNAVRHQAEIRAARWAGFISDVGDIDGILARGHPTARQIEELRDTWKFGRVFRFSLFDRAGTLVMRADPDALRFKDDLAEVELRNDADAVRAIGTGAPLVLSRKACAHDGDLPERSTQTYAPLFDDAGTPIGAVKFEVDETRLFEIIIGTFKRLMLILGVLFALVFGLPAIVFHLRARMAEDAAQTARFRLRHDRLTGTLDRAAFTELFAEHLRAASLSRMFVAVVHIDIRQFKLLNDMHGYAFCDTLLVQVAAAIRAGLRSDDLVARFGADCFVFSFCGYARDALETRIDAIVTAITEPRMTDGKIITVSLSAGGDIFQPARDTDVDAILSRSQIALIQAQLSGGNRFLAYDPAFESTLRLRRDLEKRIIWATDHEGFEVFYQPLLHQSSRTFSGFEALLRLPDGAGGYISPADFIPVAERMGLIDRIGAWVLNDAMRAAKDWPDAIKLSVNLSARQFEDGSIVGIVTRALSEHDFPASRLVLEVTETVLMKDGADVAEQLMDLRMLGIAIAMDDFGIGYSSLGYLWRFGFDKIKIDRSFISEMVNPSSRAADVVATIIMLGHKLDMTVTAEGIETADQARMLAELGCDEFQGFYYGKPVPLDAVRQMLAQMLTETDGRMRA